MIRKADDVWTAMALGVGVLYVLLSMVGSAEATMPVGYFDNHTVSDLTDEILGTPTGWAAQPIPGPAHMVVHSPIEDTTQKMIVELQSNDALCGLSLCDRSDG